MADCYHDGKVADEDNDENKVVDDDNTVDDNAS